MTSSDKKIAITPKPKLPSPSSSLISHNRFIPLSPYSFSYSPRPRPTYSALAHIPNGNSPPLLLRQYSVKWWKQIDEGQADVKAVSEYYNSLIKKSPSISMPRTSITDVDAIERIQAARSSKEEIQKILNEVRRSPASKRGSSRHRSSPKDEDRRDRDRPV
uniref:Reverse transcriptase domain, zinc finger, CCHC-type, aspartic peptidase domain protein n=1 Tax=Tanacetum cinerariifolium TaxID=118510 RepID=A0A6L2MIM6_TANCI|nr:reverse transcriptase domain, zinc finger, CCHC-type, aspartic peptidase domain protein [Tanacetum cinerariifolium]